jgi:HSP20 family protein
VKSVADLALQYAFVAHTYRERRGSDEDVQGSDFFEEDVVGPSAGECAPPMDVIETAEGIEVHMDLPGLPPDAIRLLFSRGALIIAGRKHPGACVHREAAFHLAERSFGRFVRAVRVTGAFDAGRASATLLAGELRVVLPRIEERRGREIHIPITQP